MTYREILKEIAKNRQAEIEMQAFKNLLADAANKGKYMVTIDNLDKSFSTIYKSGELWEWCRHNDISLSGGCDSDGKNPNYIFNWQ